MAASSDHESEGCDDGWTIVGKNGRKKRDRNQKSPKQLHSPTTSLKANVGSTSSSTQVVSVPVPIDQTAMKRYPTVVCLELDEIKSDTMKEIAQGNIPEPNKKDMYGFNKWIRCKVGSRSGYTVDATVRNGLKRESDNVSIATSSVKSIIETLKLMYPIKLAHKYPIEYEGQKRKLEYGQTCEEHEMYSWIWPALEKSVRKKIDGHQYRYYYDRKEDSGKIKLGLSTLFYKEEDFFAKHTDSRGYHSTIFATILIFYPTPGLEGGDLILYTDSSVYDPNSILDKSKVGKVRLRVNRLTKPVLIAFQVNVPHEVEVVTAGYRICHKGYTVIPDGFNYFNNTDPNQDMIDGGKILASRSTDIDTRISKLQAKIAKLEEQKRQLVQVSSDTLTSLLNEDMIAIIGKIEESDQIYHMVVLPTNLSEDTEDSYILGKMTDEELALYNAIKSRYPYTTVKKMLVTRKVFDEDDHYEKIYDRDVLERMAVKPAPGSLELPDFDGSIHYFGDPNSTIFGYRTDYEIGYNDENYDQVKETVLIVVICVHKEPALFI